MVIAVTKEDRLPFIHPLDKELPANQQTTFYAIPMTVLELNRFMNKYVSEEEEGEEKRFPVAELTKDMSKLIGGWKNFKNSKGQEIKFPVSNNGGMAEEGWEYISTQLFPGLIQALIEVNNITGEEAKN